MLPTFLVIGALKAGTTSLAAYLDAHPDVYIPPRKELAFFTEEHNWLRGRDWYESCFAPGRGCRAAGEVSPHYAWWPSFAGAPERAAALVPAAKIVFVVRDPFDRMRSMYQQAVRFSNERRSFDRVILEVPDYVETSCYATQLERWLDWYPREHVLVLTTEALRNTRAATLARVYGFLGVDAKFTPPALDSMLNRSVGNVQLPSGPPRSGGSLSVPVQQLVAERLAPEAAALRPFLPEFDGWALGDRAEGVG